MRVVNGEDGDDLERQHHVVGEPELSAEVGLVLQVAQRGVVVRRVGRDGPSIPYQVL
jgi:hypothetical protein